MSISLAAASNGGAAAATAAAARDAGSQSPNAAPTPAPAVATAAASNAPSSPPASPSSSSSSLGWRARLPPSVIRAFVWCDHTLQDNSIVLVVLMALTLMALFIDDFRCALAPTQADTAIFTTTLCVFVFFCLELAVNCLVKPGYPGGFFFVLDLVAVLSLLPDIPFIWMPLLGLQPSDAWDSAGRDVQRTATISRRMDDAQRWARFIRLIRLVRIAKLFELIQRKAEQQSQIKKRIAQAAAAAAADADSPNADTDDHTRPSQVGQHLSEQTTRKVVLLVLLMLFGIPLLQPQPEEHSEEFTLQELHKLASSNLTLGTYEGPVFADPAAAAAQSPSPAALTPAARAAANATMQSEISWVRSHYQGDLLYLRLRGSFAPEQEFQSEALQRHRTSEVKAVELDASMALFSTRAAVRLRSLYALLTTCVVILLLCIGAVLFHRNNHRMVIVPIERMMATIVALQQNPLAKATLSQNDGAGGGMMAHGADGDAGAHDGGLGANNETSMLERTLERLRGLLQVGFGEAGSKMISKCMNLNEHGDLDPLVDGAKMLAIFGFCDIRRFTDATEYLREDVMMYVNEIAAIVHSNVSSMDGSPNKNIGDAFLLVWRLPPAPTMDALELFVMTECQPPLWRPSVRARIKRKELLEAQAQASREGKDDGAAMVGQALADEAEAAAEHDAMMDRAKKAGATLVGSTVGGAASSSSSAASLLSASHTLSPAVRHQVSILADKALVSFLRIIVEIAASAEVARYAAHPRILAAFQNNFQVQLGFGLHCGWAIEGPIGSRYKIDASYLSPHVNLSETLQDATKIYGVPLLVSGEFYSLCSTYLKSFMRRLDVVRVSGREAPISLYTFDMHPAALAAIVGDELPSGYDVENDSIEVMEYAPPAATAAAGASAAAARARAAQSSMDEPFSPGSGGGSSLPHDLYRNPFLNPSLSDFSVHTFESLHQRSAIQQSSPIGSYHLVRNFRLSALQCGIPPRFFDVYAQALEAYLSGEWSAAHPLVLEAQRLYPQDQSCKVLVGVMKEHQFVAPMEWSGWHEV